MRDGVTDLYSVDRSTKKLHAAR